jgi:hypothetical protein
MGQKRTEPPEPKAGLVAAIGPAARLLGIGWFFVLAIVGGAALGWWFGQRFSSTTPQVISAIVGLLLGVALAGFGGYQFVRETLEQADDVADRDGGPSV